MFDIFQNKKCLARNFKTFRFSTALIFYYNVLFQTGIFHLKLTYIKQEEKSNGNKLSNLDMSLGGQILFHLLGTKDLNDPFCLSLWKATWWILFSLAIFLWLNLKVEMKEYSKIRHIDGFSGSQGGTLDI